MRFVGLAIAFVGCLAGSVAGAQNFSSDTQTRLVVNKYATCAVGYHPRKASEAVLRNVDSLTLRTDYRILIDGDCLRSVTRLEFPGDFYLYALADALTRRFLTLAPVPDLSNVPPLAKRPRHTFEELKRKFGYDAALSATNTAVVFEALNDYGECVVRRSPANAKALLMTEPGSPMELGRYDALQPALAECWPEGKTIQMSKLQLRGTIALNYYRLAQAALQVPVP